MSKPFKILHAGDIHIFLYKRHEEFKKIILQLCELLVKEKIDLVYIGGDVIDSKAKLSPEQIQITTWFFYQISNLCPIIMIPGNHDVDLKRKHSLDALTPIIEVVDGVHPIYYLKDSGIYNLYDINWVVWSCLDGLNPYNNTNHSTNDFSIGCYHGLVEKVKVESGFQLTNGVSLDIFKNCNNVFLNDIHIQTFFRNNEIGYSNSLYQVDKSEGEEKGVLVWTWNTTKYEPKFFSLPNEHGYQTYKIKDIKNFDILQVKPFSPYKIIRLLYVGKEEDYSFIKFNEIKRNLKTSVSNEIILDKQFSKLKKLKTIQINKVTKDFFSEFYKSLSCDIKQVKLLKQLDEQFDKLVDKTDFQIGEYVIKELEIHNFKCYGEHNVIKFDELQGVIGLFQKNGSGKCVEENTEIEIEFDEEKIIQKLGFLPKELE